ncbi:hypothetical protein O181_031131 [Austropuccinia psidii MF-1]|uniref:Protein-serine/threonine kinase n=1 Tax=Austropuccinia psidii MF-1 TaxID=1389203 RepID=A0A9Q3CU93_9BASI|nr:hypothetical protein [Austropuccinia psidii MF-1]
MNRFFQSFSIKSSNFNKSKILNLTNHSQPIPFSLRQLIFFGKLLLKNQSNSRFDEIEQGLVKGANLVKTQLSVRLAHQIRQFESLPYIVTSNQFLNKAYDLYLEGFHKIADFPEISNASENKDWCELLKSLLTDHKLIIPHLAIGVAESANHLSNSQIEQFLTQILHSRIARRVLAEHHIALTNQFQINHQIQDKSLRCLGIIDTELHLAETIQNCIKLTQTTLANRHPSILSNDKLTIQINGEKNVKFAYISDHLEYILFELLLYSSRQTIHHAALHQTSISSLPINIQIASSPTHITVRISDNAGGILSPKRGSFSDEDAVPPSVSKPEMFSFLQLTSNMTGFQKLIGSGGMEGKVSEQVKIGQSTSNTQENYDVTEVQEAHLRIGLPLSLIYAQFLGGTLQMSSIPGSSDFVLCVPKLGTTCEPKIQPV